MGRRQRKADPKWVAWMRDQRRERSFQAIANHLNALGVQVDQSTLYKYEDERRMPAADVLWGLGRLYG